jgi:hypothetical protein
LTALAAVLAAFLAAGSADAKSVKAPAPAERIKGVPVNDLPVPFNLQKVIVKDAITVSWEWLPPENRPQFQTFGFEVDRMTQKSSVLVTSTAYEDAKLEPGSYSYRVRARGTTRVNGKPVTHISDWSEPVGGEIKLVCSQPPQVALNVEPIQRPYAPPSALRFKLTGQATVVEGCTLGAVRYHIDSGTGLVRDGVLKTDAEGRFTKTVDAIAPEDEAPSGNVTFQVTASAENEAGPTTSDAYTISLELQDKFAPRQGY